jgi:hypothetical protein
MVDSSPCLVFHIRGKGKMKWIHDDDDIPLSQLMKSRCVDSCSLDSLSLIEIAAYSLTQLQHAPPEIGPVLNFMDKPLLDFQGCIIGVMPQPMSFAPDPTVASSQELPPPFTPAENSSISPSPEATISQTKTHSTISSVGTLFQQLLWLFIQA